MTKSEQGEFLIQMGAFLLALPFIAVLLVSVLYFVSLIKFTVLTLIVVICLAYFGLAIGLILYGKRLID